MPNTQQAPQILHTRTTTDTVARVGDRTLELELFHRWSTDTYCSFSLRDGDDDVWRLVVAQDALHYDFLLHAIFAISSLHVAITTSPDRSQTYQLAALEYHNLAIAAFQADNRPLTSANHQAMYAFSIINLALAVALPRYSPREVGPTTIGDSLVTMFGLLQGVVSIFLRSRTWLDAGPFQNVVDRAAIRFSLDNIDTRHTAAIARLRTANDEGYRALHADPAGSPHDAVCYHEANAAAIEKLEECFGWDTEDGRHVSLRWLATLEQRFVEAIAEREPVAMLITLHWAILLDRLSEKKWWAKSSGKLLVTELSMALRPCKPEWETAISWVHEQVGLPPLSGPS